MTNSELLAKINQGLIPSGTALFNIFTKEFCRGLNQHDIRVFMIAADKQVAKNRDLQNLKAAEGRVMAASMNERMAARWEMVFTNLYECYSWDAPAPVTPAPVKAWEIVEEVA